MRLHNVVTFLPRRFMEHFGFIIPRHLQWENPLAEEQVARTENEYQRTATDAQVVTILRFLPPGSWTPYEFGPPVADFVNREAY